MPEADPKSVRPETFKAPPTATYPTVVRLVVEAFVEETLVPSSLPWEIIVPVAEMDNCVVEFT